MAIDNTKESIVNVANSLFSKFGFHKTSMDEIAKIARKAKGSLYYHFSGKEELFKEVVSNEMIILKSKLNIIVDNTEISASDKLENYLIKRMEALNSAAIYHETIRADLYEHFYFIDELRDDLDKWEKESLKKIIDQGIKNNEFIQFDDTNAIVDVFIMVLKGLEIPFYLQEKYDTYLPHFENLMKIVTKGLSK